MMEPASPPGRRLSAGECVGRKREIVSARASFLLSAHAHHPPGHPHPPPPRRSPALALQLQLGLHPRRRPCPPHHHRVASGQSLTGPVLRLFADPDKRRKSRTSLTAGVGSPRCGDQDARPAGDTVRPAEQAAARISSGERTSPGVLVSAFCRDRLSSPSKHPKTPSLPIPREGKSSWSQNATTSTLQACAPQIENIAGRGAGCFSATPRQALEGRDGIKPAQLPNPRSG